MNMSPRKIVELLKMPFGGADLFGPNKLVLDGEFGVTRQIQWNSSPCVQ